jgi:hypothetical protein
VSTIKGDVHDDWAVIGLCSAPVGAFPVIQLSSAVAPAQNAYAFVVHHPGGQRKRVSFVRNQITWFNDRVVQYLSDTQTGSSGSPVFDDHGRLIALHRAGGRPQSVAGKEPLRKNEGVRISRVAAGIAQLGITLP